GERVALQAGGAVPDEADGVDGLAGAAGGDDDVASGEVPAGGAAGQHVPGDLEQLGGLGQPPGAGVPAGEAPGGRFDDDGAAGPQGRHVRLGRGVLPHLGVHRGGEHDGAARGEQRVGEQVVGEPGGGAGEQVGGGGGDEHQVRLLPEPDVRDVGDAVPH